MYVIKLVGDGLIFFFQDCLSQHAIPSLPFGGVGESGMGAYHGVWGFEAFSHHKYVTILNPQ